MAQSRSGSRARSNSMARKKRRTSKSTPGWVWLLAGLGIGLLVAWLVYIRDQLPVQETLDTLKQKSQATKNDARAVKKPTPAPPPPPPAKTKYEFYSMLPEMEVAVPEDEPDSEPSKPPKPIDKPGTYVLQAGSFRSFQQADQLKAQLALMGLEAHIQTVTIDNKNTWHRVRLGPFRELAALNHTRAKLKQENIGTILLKLKG